MNDSTRIPVIVGVGQITDTVSPPEEARSPIDLIRDAALLAAHDSGAGEQLYRNLDSITVIRLFGDSVPRFKSPFGSPANPPWSLALRLGAQPGDLVYPPAGGDSPQVMLARACERIAQGQSQAALVAGGEALRTELAARRAGLKLQWDEDAPKVPDTLEAAPSMYTAAEEAHGMRSAIAMYALIGQALRAVDGQSMDQYRAKSAELFARFAAVAKDNPLATRRDGCSAADLATVSAENPYVGFPYTKRMVASAYIDQAAAVLVVSEARADELSIPTAKRVYLHGTAHAHDSWFVSERSHLHTSPAMRLTASHALAQSGKRLDEMAFLDLYSCFPSAVQMACRELGIAAGDARGLTVTGGLPFFGGPGNNYVTHAIAQMVDCVRKRPGSWGLVGANGGLVTKQSMGVYSTVRPATPFRIDDAAIQAEIDRAQALVLAASPIGPATVETYSVLHGKQGPETGLIFGRLDATGERFVANTPSDPKTMAALEAIDCLRLPGFVKQHDGRNIFTPDFSRVSPLASLLSPEYLSSL
ncbi:MAG: acetyl-CoA acetyltransferase [Polaromonas sp.]|uniref:acetyl-CoA acetyltransferase n=1 Tax=Polaromonas sp. TaxID=1869339 RepID=UPI00248A0023|nr:acetyl-CoA acetyltransferase [Polaromonas sp.]MDI1240003.1 acetyl-CoA acetyltransferase [Polaromonas sp.]